MKSHQPIKEAFNACLLHRINREEEEEMKRKKNNKIKSQLKMAFIEQFSEQ